MSAIRVGDRLHMAGVPEVVVEVLEVDQSKDGREIFRCEGPDGLREDWCYVRDFEQATTDDLGAGAR